MRTSSPLALRGGLIGVFAVLLVALVGPTAVAQFRPPTIPPRPPVIPPPPRFPTIPEPRFPTIPEPRFPTIPEPRLPGMGGGIGGPGIGGGIGGPGFGGTLIEHTCGKCRTVMARNNDAMGFTGSCPGCGLRYTFGTAFDDGRARPNSGAGLPGGAFVPPVTPANPPPVTPDPTFVPVATPNPNPAFGIEPVIPPVTDPTPVTPSGGSPPSAAPKSSNKTLILVGGIVLAILVILGMVLGVMYVRANAKRQARGGRTAVRRRRDYD